MKSSRILYMDVLRILSTILIFVYHLRTELPSIGLFPGSADEVFRVGPVHIIMAAVAVFFLLSGAGLALSLEKSGTVNWKDWYFAHFKRLLLPYYLSYALVYLCMSLGTKQFPYVIASPWRLVFTLLGVDGYLYSRGIPTWYLWVGEWFFGCLVILYLLFPLCYRLIKRFPALPWILFGLFLLLSLRSADPEAAHTRLLFKSFDFLFGISIAVYGPRARKRTLRCCAGILLLPVLCSSLLHTPIFLNSALLSLSLFLFCFSTFPEPSVPSSFQKTAQRLASYCFPFYLVHHAVIMLVLITVSKYQLPATLGFCLPVILFFSALFVLLVKKLEQALGKTRRIHVPQEPENSRKS